LKDQRAVSELINIVRNQNGFFVQTVRRAAVLALGSIGGEQAKAELRAVAENSWEDDLIRDEAAQAVR
jgi:HEAT repeat protein